MNRDTTYIVEAERWITSDTIYYRVNKDDIKTLYEKAFSASFNEDSVSVHMTLTFTYIPLIFVFTFLIVLVNWRWNKQYKRFKSKESEVELSEEDLINIRKMDLQKYRTPDRVLFYLVVWVLSAVFDSLMLLNGLLDVPYAAIGATIFTSWRVAKRLVGGSILMGVDDSDLIDNYSTYLKELFVGGLKERIKKIMKL